MFAGLLDVAEKDYKLSRTPGFYVAGLINDWNQGHENLVNEIAVFSIGGKSDLFEEIVKSIPQDNPIFSPEPAHCEKFGTRKAAFIIIVSDNVDFVSNFV